MDKRCWLIAVILTSLALNLMGCGKELEALSDSLKDTEIDSVSVTPIATEYGPVFPIDLQSLEAEISLDEGAQTISIKSTLKVAISSEEYKPLFALPELATNLSLTVDGTSIAATELKSVKLPSSRPSNYKVYNRTLDSGAHTFVLEYKLLNRTSLLSDFADTIGKGLQTYLPCNPMLYDQFQFSGTVKVLNTSGTYRFYSNADVTSTGINAWTFTHSNRVNALAPYFHLLSENSIVGSIEKTYAGLNGNITVQVYRTDSTAPNSSDAADIAITALEKYETLLGPYAHGNKFVIYIVPGSGGMEFAGATISSLSALKHEVFHSWFATGVFPRYYPDAWLDEALARWFDNDGPVAQLSNTSPIRLSGFSPYSLYFPTEAYSYGSKLMAHLAANAGGKATFISYLSEFYQENKLKTITTEMFKAFMSKKMNTDWTNFFSTYVYNSTTSSEGSSEGPLGGVLVESFPPKNGLEGRNSSGKFNY